MKITCTHLILLLVVACMAVPVLADDVNITTTTTAATTVAVTNETTVAMTTTAVPTATATTEATTNVTTAVPTTTITTVPSTTATTVATATTATTGNVFVTSSPPGAAILIDGTYYGTTPYNVNGLSPGNHLIRLSLSGYIDYEGTIYVIAGQETAEYGTLHPMSTGQSQITAATPSVQPTPSPTQTVLPETTSAAPSDGPLDSPTVIAALIGIVTAAIGAGATIFTHNAKVKAEVREVKDGKEKKE